MILMALALILVLVLRVVMLGVLPLLAVVVPVVRFLLGMKQQLFHLDKALFVLKAALLD